jgi:cytochrome P450
MPIASARRSLDAFTNWGQYMKAIHDQKVEHAKRGEQVEGMDMMGALVKSSMIDQAPPHRKRNSVGTEKDKAEQTTLSISEKLGDAFVLLIAGHETTANSVHFSLMFLAMSPGSQRRLQREVDDIFGDTPPDKWDYDSCINACLGGMLGAVLNEELRLMPPVISIPKSVRQDQDQTIVLDGKKVVLPKGSFVNVSAASVHRNPRYWPSHGVSKNDGKANDLDDFIPERWLVSKGKEDSGSGFNTPEQSDSGDEDLGFTGRDTAPQLFHPVRGSFIPFSDGPRSCPGRRLAQVEFVVVISVIFQKYSIELAVDEWATDKEVANMGKQERIEVYKKAQQKAREILRRASTRLTLKLHDAPGYIPVRLVLKGEERFVNLME